MVDDTLEALGAPKEYHVLRKWVHRITIGWNVSFFIDLVRSTSINFAFHSHENLLYILYESFIFVYLNYIIVSSVLICETVLGYASSRFHRINNLLLCVIYSDIFENNADYRCRRQNRSILDNQRITGDKNRKQYVWNIM
ncbi:hypothetical protein ALC62_11597 [Cyphomyrmex costatus]|uniref:Uncharacterized protein n=1 Tax=Cyphomyrmex costatus TaxID=456900 RepID=A0A151IC90_9HYME|nr:hypothetical protein ALC62_11597 [Cyphomyrmex costatus]